MLRSINSHENQLSRAPFPSQWLGSSISFYRLFDHQSKTEFDALRGQSPLKQLEWLMSQAFPVNNPKEKRDLRASYCAVYLQAIEHEDSETKRILESGQKNGWSPVEQVTIGALLQWAIENGFVHLPLFMDMHVLQKAIAEEQTSLEYFLEMAAYQQLIPELELLFNAPNLEQRLPPGTILHVWKNILQFRHSETMKVFLEKLLLSYDTFQREPYLKEVMIIQDKALHENFIGMMSDLTKAKLLLRSQLIEEMWGIAAENGHLLIIKNMLAFHFGPSQDMVEIAFTLANQKGHQHIVKFLKSKHYGQPKIYPSDTEGNQWQNPNSVSSTSCCSIM